MKIKSSLAVALVAFITSTITLQAGEFLLAEKGYGAKFYLGWDYPRAAQAAIDAVVKTVREKSGETLRPYASQANPRAGYIFATVQPWCAADAYFAKIDHGILEIHATNEKSLGAALEEFNEKYLKQAKGNRLAFTEVALKKGPQPEEVREAEIERVRALRAGSPDWENELVNSRNRCEARTDNLPEGYAIKLNGMWRHHWAATPARRPQGFEQPNFNDSAWRKIPVPSCIETLGLNTPWYVDDYYFHPHVPPKIGCEWNPVSSYCTTFSVPEGWRGRKTYLRFCGVATAYYLWVNGKMIGYSEDSHLPFEFDVTDALKGGENTLAVEVYQFCDGEYLENNDRFRLTGIFRDVVLWSKPADGVGDWHWETKFNDDMSEAELSVMSDRDVECELFAPDGRSIARFAKTLKVTKPQLWSDEQPTLYTLKVRRNGDERKCRVGFRKIAIATDGAITLNGKAIKLKGINRSDFSAETGWTLTDAEIENDVRMMKKANFNLVRTSHNPNSSKFYEACDEMGMLVQAEGNVESHGMGYGTNSLANPLSWSVAYTERNVNQVKVLRNHPSIVMWSLGNEAGPGPNAMFARDAVLALDTSRLVMYRNDDGKFDVDGACYMGAAGVEACARERKTFFHSEYAHAMGNTFGDFHTFWDEDGKGYWFHPCLTGGAVWDWADQTLWKKSDIKGADGKALRFLAYGGDWDDQPNQGNDCANGILLADRKWNPALTEIKHAQRPITVKSSKGGVEIWNRSVFTASDAYAAEWALIEDGVKVAAGAWQLPAVGPMAKKTVPLPQTGYAMKSGREYFINFAFKLRQANTWAEKGWVIADDQVAVGEKVSFDSRVKTAAKGVAEAIEDDRGITLRAGDTEAVFCRDSGLIAKLTIGGKVILEGEFAGPRLTCAKAFTDSDNWMNERFMKSGLSQLHYNPKSLKVTRQNGAVTLAVDLAVDSPLDRGFSHKMVWTLYGDGTLKLENETEPWGTMPTLPRFGLSLRLNDEFEKLSWYGRGPDENYVDRNQGTFIGRYSSTVTEQFVPYTRPQDNGYKTDVREVTFTGADGRGVTIAADRPLFMQALRYTWDDLNGARHRNKERKRWSPLVPRKEVCVNLDILQTGLGMSSCGPSSLTKIKIGKERWTVVFRQKDKESAKARVQKPGQWKMFDRRLGMFIHWGIYSVGGWHEQHQWRRKLSRAEYAKFIDEFKAEKFNADHFVDVAESAGAEYIVFTSKHHDGFCMWDTATTDYKVTNTPAKRDIIAELAEACHRRGMKLGFYFSNPDWHASFANNAKSTHQIPMEAGDKPDLEKYKAYVQAQVTELLTKYGDICCFFWDIRTHVDCPEMDELVRRLQPGIMIDNRGWNNESTCDYRTPERDWKGEDADCVNIEACDSVGVQSWGYRANEDYHTLGYLTRAIDSFLSIGGNFLLNVGPKSDGTIPEESVRLMEGVGKWYRKVRESYRGVANVPRLSGQGVHSNYRTVTRRGDTLYVHFPKGFDATGLSLAPLDIVPERATLLNNGAQLKTEIDLFPWECFRSGKPSLHVWGISADDFVNEAVVIKLDMPKGKAN